jgi:hypothetical protein
MPKSVHDFRSTRRGVTESFRYPEARENRVFAESGNSWSVPAGVPESLHSELAELQHAGQVGIDDLNRICALNRYVGLELARKSWFSQTLQHR